MEIFYIKSIIVIIIRKLIEKAMLLRALAHPDQVKTETLAFCVDCQSYLGSNHIHSSITYVIRLIYSTAMMMIIVSGEQDVTVPVSKGAATALAWTNNLGPGYISGATIITMVTIIMMLMDIIM